MAPVLEARRVTPMLRDRLEAMADALERKSWIIPVLISGIYFPIAVLVAVQRPLWNDELFTWYIGSLPSLKQVWGALLTGVEQLPPLFFAVTRLATIPGMSALTIRLPAIVGFWVCLLCLYVFLSRECGRLLGGIGGLLPCLTGAFYYASEARPYGLVLGFAGLALLAWQRAGRGRGILWSLLLWIALACAYSCHYYAVFIAVPIAAGELARWIQTRRVNLLVWLATVLSPAVLLLYLPLLQAARSFTVHFWAHPDVAAVKSLISHLTHPIGPVLLVVSVITCTYLSRARRQTQPLASASIPFPDVVVAFAFALLPLYVFLAAKALGGGYTERYVIAAVVGMALLLCFGLHWLVPKERALQLGIFVLFGVVFVAGQALRYHNSIKVQQSDQLTTYHFLQRTSGGQPIVIGSPHLFFEVSHAFRGSDLRFLYAADPQLALRYTGTDSVERSLMGMARFAPVNIVDWKQLNRRRGSYLVYGAPLAYDWVVRAITSGKYRTEIVARDDDFNYLFRVTVPGSTFSSTQPAPPRSSTR